MREVRYQKIDAFSEGIAEGNPAGVVMLEKDQELTPEEMQAIAREQKGTVSEVVFCTPRGPGTYTLRYYSSECEVDFCGHGSIACMYSLLHAGPRPPPLEVVTIETRRGKLPVFDDIDASDAVYISSPEPQRLPCTVTAREVSSALGIPEAHLEGGMELVNAGLRTLLVPLRGLDEVLRTLPDLGVLGAFCRDREVDIVLIFSKETSLPSSGYRTRVFAPKYGYLEDPATGSGNSALGHYLLDHGIWDGGLLQIEQGPSLDAPNIVRLRTSGPERGRRVLFGGSAITRWERMLRIDNPGTADPLPDTERRISIGHDDRCLNER